MKTPLYEQTSHRVNNGLNGAISNDPGAPLM